jgi:hypothetical protein
MESSDVKLDGRHPANRSGRNAVTKDAGGNAEKTPKFAWKEPRTALAGQKMA